MRAALSRSMPRAPRAPVRSGFVQRLSSLQLSRMKSSAGFLMYSTVSEFMVATARRQEQAVVSGATLQAGQMAVSALTKAGQAGR